MPKKKEEKPLTKKARQELEAEIMDEINTSLKAEITQDIVKDIKNSIDSEYKSEIKQEIKTELVEDIKKDIQREQKKVFISRSFKSFRWYVYLIIVVACLCYLLFRLYKTDNLNIINEKWTRPTTTQVSKDKIEETTEEVKDLNYYVTNYGYLLNNLKISNVELVNNTYLAENISMSDKLTLAYGIISEEDILTEGIIHTLSEERLVSAYQSVFGSSAEYAVNNFVVRGLNYAYSSSSQSYMAIGNEDTTISYVNNIIENIKEEENDIVFQVRTYVIKDNGVYSTDNLNHNLLNVEENMDLSKIQNKLASVEYRFTKDDNGYRIVSISKK